MRINLDGHVGLETDRLQQRTYRVQAIMRHDSDGVAGLIVNVRTFQRQLDVPHIFAGASSGQSLIGQYRGLEWVSARVSLGNVGGARLRRRDQNGSREIRTRIQSSHDLVDPAPCRHFELDVAFLALTQTLRAQGVQARVELPTRLAELLVARIPQGEHAEAQVIEAGGLCSVEPLEKWQGALRWVAVPVSTHDEDHRLSSLQVGFTAIHHVEKGRCDRALRELIAQEGREPLAIAALRAIQNEHRGARGAEGGRTNRSPRVIWAGCDACSCCDGAGEIAAQPKALIGPQTCNQHPQPFDSGGVERRVHPFVPLWCASHGREIYPGCFTMRR